VIALGTSGSWAGRREPARWRAVWALCALWIGSEPLRADEPFRYYKEGEHFVITNQPVAGAKALPGFEGVRRVSAGLPASPYDGYIEKLGAELDLPPDLIKSVVLVESGFDPHAVSPKGAQGLMQLMPATARQYGVRDAFDPLQNLRAGSRHLRSLLDEFEGDVTLALAAYNAGSGAVRRHGGIPDYRETRDYVRRVHDSMGRPRRAGRVPERPAPSREPIRVERSADGSVKYVN
jgi:soluble lytic murein transglycosylase-like protein